MVCPIQGNPASKDYIGNKLNMQIPDFPIIKIIYTNSDNKEIIAKMKEAVLNKQFQAYLKKSGYSDVNIKNITQNDVDNSWKHGVKVYELYWK